MDLPDRLAADLARLNPAEREVLVLLGDGHTAKSIATLTGRSAASVNERLRQARRKTGVASSRELARLLKARKNGDEQIGMAVPPAAPPSLQPRITDKRGLIMTIATILTIAALALTATQQREAPAPAAQAALPPGLLPPIETEPRHLAELVRSETRDEAWAPRAEAALRARYAKVAAGGRLADLRIVCAATTCETSARITVADARKVNAVMQALQDGKGNRLDPAVTLENTANVFGQTGFVAYWKRKG